MEFGDENCDHSNLGSSQKNWWSLCSNIKTSFEVDIERIGKFSIGKSCRVLNSHSAWTTEIKLLDQNLCPFYGITTRLKNQLLIV